MNKIRGLCYTNEKVNYILVFIYRILHLFDNKTIIKGKNNLVYKKRAFLRKTNIQFYGNNNKVCISANSRLKDCLIIIHGDNHELFIDYDCRLYKTKFWFENNGSKITLSKGVTTEGNVEFASIEDNAYITVGEDCMFSHDIEIRTGDSHPIYEIGTNKRVNEKGDVVLCNHVWVGAYSKILKGVTIETGSIIGEGSIVTKSIPPQSIAAGIPAKVKREGIYWSREASGASKNDPTRVSGTTGNMSQKRVFKN